MKHVVGTMPWFPAPLRNWTWLTEPIRAERLAAWRIATGLVLMLDVFLFYMPFLGNLYGPGSLAGTNVFAERFGSPHWNWSLLNWLPSEFGPTIGIWIWIAAAVALTVGWHPRYAAAIAWALSLSFYNTNFYLHNSGDRIRHFLLLLLILAPSDAAWSVTRWRKKNEGPVYVPAWPARLMLVQMAVMYFTNGLYKLQGTMWWEGSVMHYVNHDLGWARWSAPAMPYWATRCLTWGALIWEAGFPLWIMLRQTRTAALLIGVLFHLVTFFHLEIAAFPLYALCLYAPLAPWERLSRRQSTVAPS